MMKRAVGQLAFALCALCGLVVVGGCPAPAPEVDAGNSGPVPGQDQTVSLFDEEPIYFAGEDNRREVIRQVAFPPASETFSAVRLDVNLECPAGGCDVYDRLGALSIASDDGLPIEFARFVTPFGLGTSFSLDVTALRPLFTTAEGETKDVTAFVDTWVGPGSQFGDGWTLTVDVVFEGGVVERPVVDVIPLWARQRVTVGDPARPAPVAAGSVTAAFDGTHDVDVWTFVSGHGQGNANNCAEFCPTFHALSLEDGNAATDVFTRDVWRDDCEQEAPGPQPGTWTLSRAGWCPGLPVTPWVESIRAENGITASWDPGPYVNTCRPDASDCGGCTLGTGCEYDGGAHTEPGFELSALVIVYE